RYQWRFGGAIIPGATNSTLVLNNVQMTNAGTYIVAVTNDVGSITVSTLLSVDPTFTKITTGEPVKPVPVSFGDSNYPDSCAWADYNNDGYLDLAVWNLNTAAPSGDA